MSAHRSRHRFFKYNEAVNNNTFNRSLGFEEQVVTHNAMENILTAVYISNPKR